MKLPVAEWDANRTVHNGWPPIVNAMRSRAILQELGTNGCRYYREHFSEAETMEKLMALMESLVPPIVERRHMRPSVKFDTLWLR